MYPYIKIFGICVPTYGACLCLAFFVCAVCIYTKSRKAHINSNDLLIIFATSAGCGMLGGSIMYIFITYDLKTIYQQISVGNFTFFAKQGTVFYGGLVGGALGAVFSAKMLKIRREALEACVVPYIPLGHAIGRIGCLFAGCCYGFPYEGVVAVSTGFGSEGKTVFPIQGIEALANLFIMGALLLYTKNKRKKHSVLYVYLLLYACVRFLIEFFRGDDIRGGFLSFSTSQWISLIVFVISFVVLRRTHKEHIKA